MSFDEIVKSIASAIGESVADKIGVAFRAEAHRGMCAGSVNYCPKPSGTKKEYDVMLLVLAKYKDEGRRVRFDTKEECEHFFETVLDACKYYVEHNYRVSLAGRLTYEARVRRDDKKLWMCPLALNRAFNTLDTPMELDKTLAELKKQQKAAVKKPFDKLFDGPTVPHKNFIICEQCGHPNKVGDGAR